jgi:hypothetical protein
MIRGGWHESVCDIEWKGVEVCGDDIDIIVTKIKILEEDISE